MNIRDQWNDEYDAIEELFPVGERRSAETGRILSGGTRYKGSTRRGQKYLYPKGQGPKTWKVGNWLNNMFGFEDLDFRSGRSFEIVATPVNYTQTEEEMDKWVIGINIIIRAEMRKQYNDMSLQDKFFGGSVVASLNRNHPRYIHEEGELLFIDRLRALIAEGALNDYFLILNKDGLSWTKLNRHMRAQNTIASSMRTNYKRRQARKILSRKTGRELTGPAYNIASYLFGKKSKRKSAKKPVKKTTKKTVKKTTKKTTKKTVKKTAMGKTAAKKKTTPKKKTVPKKKPASKKKKQTRKK